MKDKYVDMKINQENHQRMCRGEEIQVLEL